MNFHLIKLRELLEKFKLDAIVVYANGYEDSLFKAITGTFSILQDHILVTQNEVIISTPSYLVSELAKRTKIKIVAAEGENSTILPIAKKVGKNKRVGLAGFFKFSDARKLSPSSSVDLNSELENLVRLKSDEYIKQLAKHTRFLSQTINNLNFKEGLNQLRIKSLLEKKFVDRQFSLAFPVLVTSGKDLMDSTSLSASDRTIAKKDIICVDVGIKKDIFTTDIARMFFVNNNHAESAYEFIKSIHNKIITEFITPKTRFEEIIKEYKKMANENKEILEVRNTDFGHGIGYSLHEKPFVEEDKGIIGTNIIFTLEPTFVTKYGLMRIEDMIGILSDGTVLKLTLH